MPGTPYSSMFEMTIRALGGLLGAYTMSGDKVFLERAAELGDGLLQASFGKNRAKGKVGGQEVDAEGERLRRKDEVGPENVPYYCELKRSDCKYQIL